MNKPEYLSDRELLALIRTTEAGELLHAPRDMKQNILAKQKPNRKKQFYSYCLRVGLATAASLAILFIPTPVKENNPDAPSLTQQLYQVTDHLEERFVAFHYSLADFDFDFNLHFGGTRNE